MSWLPTHWRGVSRVLLIALAVGLVLLALDRPLRVVSVEVVVTGCSLGTPAWPLTAVVAWMVLVLLLPIQLPGFLRLRSLRRPVKTALLLVGPVLGLLAALATDWSVFSYVALGISAQIAAAANWAERGHALLGGGARDRVWAWLLGLVAPPIVVLGHVAAAILVSLTFDRSSGWHDIVPAACRLLRDLPPARILLAIWLGATLLALLALHRQWRMCKRAHRLLAGAPPADHHPSDWAALDE